MAITTNNGYKHLRSTVKRIVVQVANFFKKKKPMESIIRSTDEATGVSRRTVFRIRKELRETGKLASPKRPKRGLISLLTVSMKWLKGTRSTSYTTIVGSYLLSTPC